MPLNTRPCYFVGIPKALITSLKNTLYSNPGASMREWPGKYLAYHSALHTNLLAFNKGFKVCGCYYLVHFFMFYNLYQLDVHNDVCVVLENL